MKRKLTVLILLLSIVLSLVSCDRIEEIKGYFSSETTGEETGTESVTEFETFELPKAEFVDPLTGEPSDKDLSGKRPYAIVVKNDRIASPQFGLSKASVLYEASVEGGMTRFLALYSDPAKADKIGPVIDSRVYFYDFAANHNAIFVQAGTTSDGNKAQVSRGITALDAIVGEMAPGFYRDQALGATRGFENSVVTEANGLKSRADQFGIAQRSEKPVVPYIITDYLQTRDMSAGSYCTYLSIPFSTNMVVEYTYSTLTNKYSRVQYGEPHTDAATNKQLSFTNLIILIAEYHTLNISSGEMSVVNSGHGSGYYIFGGSRIMVTWQRTDGDNPIKLYEADGVTPLEISSGNTYIAVVSPRLSGKIEFERTSS